MARLRPIIAAAMCLWLLLCGAAYAVASLEVQHDQEHMAIGQPVHDASDHRHADEGVELLSQLFGQPGFDQLTSAWITPPCTMLAQDACSLAPVHVAADSLSISPVPPPGPPPRASRLDRGGAASG